MRPAQQATAKRIQKLLGSDFVVLEFDESTRTAAEAALAVGCDVAQIAKSIIFRASPSQRAVLVIASGRNRVDEKKIEALLGEKLKRADADFVREKTGFSIGGVAPIGHLEPPVIFIDEDLSQFAKLWAAAGTPNAVFEISFKKLVTLTDGQVASVKIFGK